MDEDKVIDLITPPWPFEDYAHVISPMPKEYGEGFVITFPDLPGCMSDGKTEAEAERFADMILAEAEKMV